MLRQTVLDNIKTKFTYIDALTEEHKPIEGNMSGELLIPFIDYLSSLKLKNNRILEIGFNAGHSAIIFSEIFSRSTIWSIDICEHPYTFKCFEYVKNNSNSQHCLIQANSVEILPCFHGVFDLIFIDGNHFGDIPQTDLRNCIRISHSDTIVVIDDICNAYYGIEPTKAWKSAIDRKVIIETYRYSHSNELGFAAGKYMV